jgi:6-phospho-beta-glucosidase
VRTAAVALAPGLAARVETTVDLAAAVDRADAVIVQFRAGGLAARAHDERFPLAENIPGDEGLGPGGLAAAWRAWPVLREILATVAERAPHAHVAILTAPLGILVRCALDAFPALDAVGLCELPAVVLGGIAASLGVPRAGFSYAGVNHLGWFTALSAGGADASGGAAGGEHTNADRDANVVDDAMGRYVATRAIATVAHRAAHDGGAYPSAEVIHAWGGVPLPYVRLIDERDAVVTAQRAAQRAGTSRGTVLARIAEDAYAAFETADAAAIASVLARRPAPWYARAVAPWLRAHRDGDSQDVFFVTARNAGYLADFPADAVVEVPRRMRAGKLVAERGPATVPEPVLRTLSSLVEYEAFAARAVTARDESAIGNALALHPWVRDAAVAARLVSGVLDRDGAAVSDAVPADAAATASATAPI